MDDVAMADAGDRMFCHACAGVWLKNAANGLNCPHCQSDFTEIIEIPPDTEDPSSRPSHDSPPREENNQPNINPWADHNPWAHEETHRGGDFAWRPGYSRRTYRSPDGRFTFTTTTATIGDGGFHAGRSMDQRQMQIDPLMPVVRSLDTIFHGLAETYRQGQPQNQTQNRSATGEGHETDLDEHRARSESPEFRATGRLFPRDADGPQPMAPPLGTLGDILELFRADFGGNVAGGGVRVMTGPNPLAMLSTLLNFDRLGDAVYSQEELDRVISQLIDQNINRTGAPPAPESAIQSLPKKKVDEEMLGSEGKAECSICMEPVELGTEVTVLPCKHWFHFPCIEAWLSQHNTCPHCRRGIDAQQAEGTSQNPVVINDSPESASPERRRSSGPAQHSGHAPPTWGDHPLGNISEANEHNQGQSSHNESSSGGGFTGWVRSHFGGS
ncbi:putative RING finger domain protein [Aspergillus thermomutatus]|uniref:RING-type E3 ubiquitin transferase n=1 Tax=Aspergillus thermomutatus TaxID=41047 RepID=A0A397H217_ASPTH|nr:uncharacterized protein CDV56_107470 [Aspergillus thermomutatus]RHZ57101.1 hypothetical protein CDV56_107470 [Aspergillus thermomutatus]